MADIFTLFSSLFDLLLKESYENAERKGPHITRHHMYTKLHDILIEKDSQFKTCLSISGSAALAKAIGLRQCKIINIEYPEHDILDLEFSDDMFDFCVSDQVLEHVEGDPFTAVHETIRVVKPGGYIVHTTCFINYIHGHPKDFWRFTPAALELLCRGKAEIVEVGGWGNRLVWLIADRGFQRTPVPADKDNPIFKLAHLNEPDWPIVTWVVGRKIGHTQLPDRTGKDYAKSMDYRTAGGC